MMTDKAPFILLDDRREEGGPCRLYRSPREIIVADDAKGVPDALEALRKAVAVGGHVAGFLGYEAGHSLEARLRGSALRKPDDAPPLLWFGVFDAVETLSRQALDAHLPDPRGAWAGSPRPRIDETEYARRFANVQSYIRAGDIYQANLSFRSDVAVIGHPLALYARLRSASAMGWGGVVFTGAHWLLSLSPELFFTLEGGLLTTRPMKGTTPRGATPVEDAAAAERLRTDPKERAENLMIVDLLRNDLSRVAVPGSVSVPALFTVESYPTLHTLTSTVTARAQPQVDAVDVLTALFPCGSVTGAPKIRAMEIIAEQESDARGPYTGAIGWLDSRGDAAFNVAIRTLVLREGSDRAELGLGSAVVADSTAPREWRECLAKGAFLTHGTPAPMLIETMHADPNEGIRDRARHLARLDASAAAFDFNPTDAGAALDGAVGTLAGPARLRLLRSRDGGLEIETGPLPPARTGPADVAVVPLPVDARDMRLRHKTTDRGFYDAARDAAGTFEVVFVDADGWLTEGSFTSLFVERDGMLLTPPLARGLLPGVLRARLIDEGRAREADLSPLDLVGGFWIGNSLRGLMRARLTSRAAPHDLAVGGSVRRGNGAHR